MDRIRINKIGNIVRYLEPLKIRLTVGTFMLLVTGLVVITMMMSMMISNMIESKTIAITQRDISLYTTKIENWFSLAIERVENLADILQAVNSEDFESVAVAIRESNDIEDVFIGFSDGSFINGGGWIAPEGWLPTTRPWYIDAKAAGPGNIAISSLPFISYPDGNLAVAISIYIPELDGVGAVAGTSILTAYIEELLRGYSNGSASSFVLLGNEGEVLVHPHGFYPLPHKEKNEVFLYQIEDVSGNDGFLRSMHSPQKTVSLDDASLGQSFLIKGNLNFLDWFLFGVVPYSFLAQQIAHYTFIIVSAITVVLIILFAGLLIFSAKILKGLEEKSTLEERLRREAQKASAEKGAFLANMSHEIRTPMNAINGMALIGLNHDDLKGKNYALERIKGASRHLVGVVNDVLDMSKIESGKYELLSEPLRFENILRKAIDIAESGAAQKNQVISVYLDPKIPDLIMGDEQKLTQVVTNLLGNAVKFTPMDGYIYLNAQLASHQGDEYSILVKVIDTGIGISQEQLPRIFEPFEQEHGTIAAQVSGTGLGLTISKKIIELTEGKIWVESTLGSGTMVAFTIKVQGIQAVDAPHSLAGLQLLAVSKNQKLLDYFEKQVSKYGARCQTVQTSEEAFKFLQQKNCDLVFIDCENEQTVGLDLAKAIKQRHINQKIIAMLAPHNWSGSSKFPNLEGVDDYLWKPLFPTALKDIIAKQQGQLEKRNASAAKQDYSAHKILVAEDIDVNQEIIASLLESTNIQIEFAQTGAEAVQKFGAGEDAYDLIFMDLHMPVMSGLEAAKRIRKIGEGQDIPIIAITANAMQSSIDECLAGGMDDYVTKPLDFSILIEKLTKYLREN